MFTFFSSLPAVGTTQNPSQSRIYGWAVHWIHVALSITIGDQLTPFFLQTLAHQLIGKNP